MERDFKIPSRNVFISVNNKDSLVPIIELKKEINLDMRFYGTRGTIKFLRQRGLNGESMVGFDYDGRVKSLSRIVFERILVNREKRSHLLNLGGWEPLDLVISDLYPLEKENFPESMDIGGQALIRAAMKNYRYVAVSFDDKSTLDLTDEIKRNNGSTTISFRRNQAKNAAKFIKKRSENEASLFDSL